MWSPLLRKWYWESRMYVSKLRRYATFRLSHLWNAAVIQSIRGQGKMGVYNEVEWQGKGKNEAKGEKMIPIYQSRDNMPPLASHLWTVAKIHGIIKKKAGKKHNKREKKTWGLYCRCGITYSSHGLLIVTFFDFVTMVMTVDHCSTKDCRICK